MNNNYFNEIQTINCIPVVPQESLDTYNKLSLQELTNIGLSLETVKPVLSKIFKNKNESTTLYKMIIPKNVKGTLQTKNGVTLGHFVDEKKTIRNRASFLETKQSLVASINPAMLMITIAMSQINNKLSELKETTEEIINFLKIKEKSKILANVNILQEISQEYKYNLDNNQYKNNKHIFVQNIKKEAEESIILARNLIINKLEKNKFFHSNNVVKKKKESLEEQFINYKLALYQFAYSTYLEVILIDNYNKDHLDNTINNLLKYIKDYNDIHSQCYDDLLKYSNTSLQSSAMKGIANVTKFAGTTISKIPGIKNGNVDEKLIEKSESLKEYATKRSSDIVESFIINEDNSVLVFVDNIKTINKMFNEEVELLVDNENLYIK